jgi:hypothetical protein
MISKSQKKNDKKEEAKKAFSFSFCRLSSGTGFPTFLKAKNKPAPSK